MNLVTEEEHARLEGGEREACLAPGGVQVPEEGLARKDREKRKTATDVWERVAEPRETEEDEPETTRWRGHGIPPSAETPVL